MNTPTYPGALTPDVAAQLDRALNTAMEICGVSSTHVGKLVIALNNAVDEGLKYSTPEEPQTVGSHYGDYIRITPRWSVLAQCVQTKPAKPHSHTFDVGDTHWKCGLAGDLIRWENLIDPIIEGEKR